MKSTIKLHELRTESISGFILACETLINGYRGDVMPIEFCPLCKVASRAKGIFKSVIDDSYCNFCPWLLLDMKHCMDFEINGEDTTILMGISRVRQHPAEYPKESLQCIERLLGWISILQEELEKR